ncbi:MAG: type II secretion system F family protein [Clostridiales bacterium]|jgi:type IV pilus assembly protein PilC|uniref:type II secretion system F family protein n=1 Tax=Aminipila sp. TaxID=2060095 RepID=UPI001D475266|nr:type II secretion system F family protein [Aminipila sp.]MBE6033106.1 type II secretion system F family protein [Clostridiales bacterium]
MKAKELSSFCMQISFLLGAGIPIDAGLSVLAEDAEGQSEKNMLLQMSEDVESGISLAAAMRKTALFPEYLTEMAQVGQETGTLETVMKSLAQYYEKEHLLAQTIKNAVTYPLIMVSMLMIVLFVLLTKVMPIFEEVYNQLGAQLSPITKNAVQIGTILSGAAIFAIILFVFISIGVVISSKKGYKVMWAEKLLENLKERSSVAITLSKRRITAVLAIAIKSGIDMEAGMDMAIKLISQKEIRNKLLEGKEKMELGGSMYDALKETQIFTGMDMQMIKVGNRSGKSDSVFEELSKKYEDEVDTAIDNLIMRFEPTMVVVLAVIVGLILLSVMMPLVGIMASIG